MEEIELAKKFGINLEALRGEQLKLAKTLQIKDSMDFSLIDKFGAIESIIVKNKIISVAIVCDKNFNVLEEQYFLDSLKFPYIYGFRSYRELPSMVGAFEKLGDKPSLVFLEGAGIIHPRLGLASHFSLASGVATIGVECSLFDINKIEGEDIIKEDKKVGRVLQSKENSNPIYISPGDKISLQTSYNLAKQMIKEPHKLPEPLHLAYKYARNVRKEFGL